MPRVRDSRFLLTDTRLRTLEGICAGRTRKEMAEEQQLTQGQINNNMMALMFYFGVDRQTCLVIEAIRKGVIDLTTLKAKE